MLALNQIAILVDFKLQFLHQECVQIGALDLDIGNDIRVRRKRVVEAQPQRVDPIFLSQIEREVFWIKTQKQVPTFKILGTEFCLHACLF